MESKIIQINNQEDFKNIIAEEKVALLIFAAEWCLPSQQIQGALKKELDQQRKKLNQQLQIPINIYVVDHDKEHCANIVRMFSPLTLPYVYLFEKGKYIAQFGGMDIFALTKIAKKALESCRAL